jgi:ketosteroid isomerase-like protein
MNDTQDYLRRVQVLEDVEAIKNMHRDYVFWINNKEWDKVIQCFADDAVVQIGRHSRRQGMAQIRSLFWENINKVNAGKGRDSHFVVMPVVHVDGDKATGHWLLYILIADPETGKPMKNTQGRHECEYIKQAGIWKFSKLTWVNPWPWTTESRPTIEDVRDLGFDF